MVHVVGRSGARVDDRTEELTPTMDHLRPVSDSSPPDGEPGRAPNAPGGDELAQLLRRCRGGDESAFARLYDATAARVHGLALRVVRDPAQAEEVTQEAFLEIWRTASRFDPDRGSALSWLLTITHRKAVDRVRSAESASRRDTAYHQQDRPVAHDVTAETAHAALEAHRVRTAMQTLTEVQREAVGLAYLGGYTHTEVARMLDLPVGTAKTRIRDGLIRLRDALGVGS
jgi:RNA polymerase sigma-70 factor (ECF subfamily)